MKIKEKFYITILVVFATLIIGCRDKYEITRNNQIPDSVPIDLNKDGETDLEFVYGRYVVDGISTCFGYTAFLLSNDREKYQILNGPNSNFAFLESGDTIHNFLNEENTYWTKSSPDFAEINNCNSELGIYSKEWTTFFQSESNTTYFGYKIAQSNNQDQLGWIKFSFDEETGMVEILEISEPENSEYILIM